MQGWRHEGWGCGGWQRGGLKTRRAKALEGLKPFRVHHEWGYTSTKGARLLVKVPAEASGQLLQLLAQGRHEVRLLGLDHRPSRCDCGSDTLLGF